MSPQLQIKIKTDFFAPDWNLKLDNQIKFKYIKLLNAIDLSWTPKKETGKMKFSLLSN